MEGKSLRRFSFAFMGGDFLGLDETENENPSVGRADSARRFYGFYQTKRETGGDCHAENRAPVGEDPCVLPKLLRSKNKTNPDRDS